MNIMAGCGDSRAPGHGFAPLAGLDAPIWPESSMNLNNASVS
jgi:hypothetical protein